MSIQNGINQNTLNSIQNNAATNLAVSQGFGGLNAAFINNNVFQNFFAAGMQSLQLTQIEGYNPLKEFTDSSGKDWKLVKACSDSSSEVPDIMNVSITDYWNHEVEGSQGKIFIYVVEGIKKPKNEKEIPCSILYSWFSTVNNMAFTPQMITQGEWLMYMLPV